MGYSIADWERKIPERRTVIERYDQIVYNVVVVDFPDVSLLFIVNIIEISFHDAVQNTIFPTTLCATPLQSKQAPHDSVLFLSKFKYPTYS